MYLKLKDGNIIYPYTLDDLKRENSNVSFPISITNDILENFDVYSVQSVGQKCS